MKPSASSARGRRRAVKGKSMKKVRVRRSSPEMRAEYDFSGGVRGKYADRFAKGSVLVLLEPDVAEVFPDAKSVNEALRALGQIIRHRARKNRRRESAR